MTPPAPFYRCPARRRRTRTGRSPGPRRSKHSCRRATSWSRPTNVHGAARGLRRGRARRARAIPAGGSGCAVSSGVPVSGSLVADRRDEAVAAPVDCLDVGRGFRVVVQGLADLADADLDRRVAHDDVGPDRREQLVLGDESLGPAGKVIEDVERLGREPNGDAAAQDAARWTRPTGTDRSRFPFPREYVPVFRPTTAPSARSPENRELVILTNCCDECEILQCLPLRFLPLPVLRGRAGVGASCDPALTLTPTPTPFGVAGWSKSKSRSRSKIASARSAPPSARLPLLPRFYHEVTRPL